MTVTFLPEAEAELLQAITYYDEQSWGLGDRFNHELWLTIDRIVANPRAWTPMGRSARKCNFHDFPYGVVYRETRGTILIVAVMNLHKRPGYWKARIR